MEITDKDMPTRGHQESVVEVADADEVWGDSVAAVAGHEALMAAGHDDNTQHSPPAERPHLGGDVVLYQTQLDHLEDQPDIGNINKFIVWEWEGLMH